MIRPFEISLHNYRAMFLSEKQTEDQKDLFQMVYKGKISNNSYKTVVLQLSVPWKFHLYSYPSMIFAIQVI